MIYKILIGVVNERKRNEKILFATKNNSKLERQSEKLKERGIEVISLNDIDVDVDVVESANTAV